MNEVTRTARAAVPGIKRLSALRWKVQLLSFLGLNALVLQPWQAWRLRGVCIPVLNCHGCPAAVAYCPVGVIGDMLQLRVVPWAALGLFGLVGIIFGRLSCGWVCPFGFLQDLIAKIPVPKWNPPRWTSLVKYFVLAGMVFAVPLLVGVDTRWFFCGVCPEGTLSGNIWYLVTAGTSIPAQRLMFLGIFLLLMLFVSRGFCRIVCPIGAGLGLFNRLSLLSIKFNKPVCTECHQCLRNCPVGSNPTQDSRSAECTMCMNCLKCDALETGFKDAGKSSGSGP